MADNPSIAEEAGIDYQALEQFVARRIRMYQQGIQGGPGDVETPRVTKRDLVTIWVTLRNVPGTEALRSQIDDAVGVVGDEICEGCGIQVEAGAASGGSAEPQQARPLETGVAADQECPKCGAPI